MANNNGLARYNQIKKLAASHNLSTKGSLLEIEARLALAGIQIPVKDAGPESVDNSATRPVVRLANIPEEIDRLTTRAVADKAAANVEMAAVSQGIDALVEIKEGFEHLTAAGVSLPSPNYKEAIEALEVRRATAVERHNLALEDEAWASALELSFVALIEASRELVALGVTLPEELYNVSHPAPYRRWLFSMTGNYTFKATVEALTLSQAKGKLINGEVEDGDKLEDKPWCKPGKVDFQLAVEQVTESAPVHSREYGCTLRVQREDGRILLAARPVEQQSASQMTERDFVFIVDGPDYEGRAVVRAVSLEQAKERLLAGEVASGDRLEDAEWGAEGDRAFREALGRLSEEKKSVPAYGHTLSYTVSA